MIGRFAGALLLIAALSAPIALAQAPAPGVPGEKRTLSAEQKQKIHEARKKAREACKAERGDAHRDCMQREMCAQAKDSAKCNERLTKAREAHKQAAENCKSAQPDKYRECMRHEMCAQAKDPVKCEARAKAHAERRKAAKKPSS
jgi:hypothetical protein